MKKLAYGIVCLAAAFAAVLVAQAALPKVEVDGDTITVTVPDGTASGTNRLLLCWGATDAGESCGNWVNSSILSEDVTSTGGTWTVSAAAKGIAEGSVLRAFIGFPYKTVEYIQSTTGTAGKGGNATDKTLAIETGIAAKTGVHVKTKMRWLALADSEFCGGRKTAGDSTRFFPVHIYQNKWFLGYGSSTANTVACLTDIDYEVESKMYLGSQTMVVDGTQIYSLSNGSTVDTTGQCAAFAAYYPSYSPTPITCSAHARCYYLKMWENGNTTDNPEGDLVRDFIPVKDSLGHGALYDQVTKKSFKSVYTGAAPVEYFAVGDETGDIVYSMEIVSLPNTAIGTYVRFSFTAVRNTAGTGLQVSELAVYDKQANRVNLGLVKAASGTATSDLSPGEYLVSHEATTSTGISTQMFDGDPATKYYRNTNPTTASPLTVTMRLANGTEIGGYNFRTADDVSNRDPVSWKVETSENGVDWEEVAAVSDFVPTVTRKVWYDGFGGTSTVGDESDYFQLEGQTFKIGKIPRQLLPIGGVITPEPVVTNFNTGVELVKDVDYTVAYFNNDREGLGVVTITGKDGTDYEGKSDSFAFDIFCRVKSITSTGTQYIDTGIVPGLTTAVEMYFNTTNCGNTALFGAGANNANNSYCLYQNTFYCFRGAAETSMGILGEAGLDAYVSISTNAADNCFMNVSGNVATKTVALTYTGANNLNIFATNVGNSKSKLTLYSFKIWQAGELVRYFVPVRSRDEVGLWDLVTDTLFRNAGTGAFLAGPDETDIAVAKIPNQFYTGSALTPSVVVSNLAGTALLVKDVDYTVAYENNVAVGKGRSIVTGIGAYTSVVTNEFAIYSLPAAPAFTSKSYVQHGLMNQWDAVDNAGIGLFDPAAKIWKDLKGDLDFTLTDRAQWNGGFLETTGYAGAAKAKTGLYLTIEIKHRTTKPRYSIPFASGYSLRHLIWYKALDQLYPWHQNNVSYNYLTGQPYSDTIDKNMAIVYGAAGGSDSPMFFYRDGARITSGISNAKMWWPGLPFVSSFPTAVIGAANASQYNFEGRLYTIRLYDCPLTDEEIAYNAAVDKVRFDGIAPADAFNSSNMRWNATSA